MELPLGKSKCVHCHQIVSDSETYSVGGHGPVCEACTNEVNCGFSCGTLPEIKRLYQSHVPPKKG